MLTYFPPFVQVVKLVKVFRVEKVFRVDKVDSETHYTGWQAVAVFLKLVQLLVILSIFEWSPHINHVSQI